MRDLLQFPLSSRAEEFARISRPQNGEDQKITPPVPPELPRAKRGGGERPPGNATRGISAIFVSPSGGEKWLEKRICSGILWIWLTVFTKAAYTLSGSNRAEFNRFREGEATPTAEEQTRPKFEATGNNAPPSPPSFFGKCGSPTLLVPHPFYGTKAPRAAYHKLGTTAEFSGLLPESAEG